jgi:PAS domain S-box-containing protein
MSDPTAPISDADILVVDDIPHNLRLLSRMLEMQGYHVRCTTSPKMVLQAVKTKPPDLILLDVKMPDMSGYELCSLLKADRQTQAIPVIFISAMDELSDKLKGFEVGGVDYVTKPFQEAEILMRVKTQITLQHQRKQLVQQNDQLRKEVKKRKQTEVSLQTSEEKYRNLVENSRDWIWECDADYRLTYSNGQVLPMLGYTSQQIVGHPISYLMDEDAGQHFISVLNSLSSDRPFARVDVLLEHQSGKRLEFEANCLAYLDENGQIQGYRGIARDVSQRKQVEYEIREALTRQKEISEFKSRFVSVISHEFRTPLTVIQSSADILQNIPCTESDREELLDRIQAAVNHMTLLVDDVVVVGQADAGKLKAVPTQLNLKQFMDELLHEFDVLSQPNHEILFICDAEDLEISVDQKLLRQTITNLLSNAVKYSPDGGVIKIRIGQQENCAEIEISDSGIGIPEADQAALFECFHRAQNVGTIPGTGIGLFITRECVRLHNGDIQVHSAVGEGTRFTIKLPLLFEVWPEDGWVDVV